jgi:RNA polymerase sigma-70 factor (ECF subfamily)
MNGADTTLGGLGQAFPPTTPDLAERLRSPADPAYREGLERLCRDYWRPVYAFLRRAGGRSNEDAKDLTQAFFAWLLEGEAIRKYAPEKGGLRPFLKTLLRRFLAHADEAAAALKRGGGRPALSLEGFAEGVDLPGGDAEALFEQAWRNEVVRRALDAVRRRRQAEGDGAAFEIYEAYVLGPGERRPTYDDLARARGLPVSDIKACLVRIRRAVREEVERELGRLTAGDIDLAGERDELFRG